MIIRRHILIWSFALLGILGGCLILIGSARADTLGFSVSPSTSNNVTVQVLDDADGSVVNGATVTVTDRIAPDSPTLAGSTKAITVSKAGYATTTIVGVASGQVTVYLKHLAASKQEVLASGTMTGWDSSVDNNGDSFHAMGDMIQAGLVLKSLSVTDLLNFDSSSFVSPLKDTIDVMGKRQIPSNVVLPKQDIGVFLGSVHLDKQLYRLPVATGRDLQLIGIQAEIDVDDVISAAMGGGLGAGLLNKAHFKKVGIGPSLKPTADFTQDIAATATVAPAHQVSVSAPPFAADVIVAAVTDIAGDRTKMVPTDIKAAATSDAPDDVQPVSLESADNLGAAKDVVALAVADKGKRLSGVMTPNAGANVAMPQFLAADSLPSGQALPADVALRAPQLGIAAAIFDSTVTPAGPVMGGPLAQADAAKTAPVWYVYVLPAAGDVQVPTHLSPEAVQSYSVLQMEFDPAFAERDIDGKTVLTKLARFTRASADIAGP